MKLPLKVEDLPPYANLRQSPWYGIMARALCDNPEDVFALGQTFHELGELDDDSLAEIYEQVAAEQAQTE